MNMTSDDLRSIEHWAFHLLSREEGIDFMKGADPDHVESNANDWDTARQYLMQLVHEIRRMRLPKDRDQGTPAS